MSRFLFLALACLAPSWVRGAEPQGLPNIVWINCEDLDPWIGAYGHRHADTPNLDRFAKEAYRFDNAFATAPICAPARSTLITGHYATSLGSQHLRCEVTLPDFARPFPTRLRELGYFVTNDSKTDYNFSPQGIYDYWKREGAPWLQRPDQDTPFFSFFVLGTTHEGPGNFYERYESATRGLSPERRQDPNVVSVPSYYPDTPKMRELLARYGDLVTALDEQVGSLFAQLQSDGLWEDTIVWFFSDHGTGLPRHKRWLLDSGLRVPLLVRVPEKFRSMVPDHWKAGAGVEELVSFVDFAPTVLRLAGDEGSTESQGRAFMGSQRDPAPSFVFGARDRADDLFEFSRAVHDGRYIYVRHFLPHLPWIRSGRIMGNQKESFAELRRARDQDGWSVNAGIWAPEKPVEELYDTESDPDEMHNLADSTEYRDRLGSMRSALREWMVSTRDTGVLPEAEYHRRAAAAGMSIGAWARRPDLFPVTKILDAAWGASDPSEDLDWVGLLDDEDSGLRYWGALGARISGAPLGTDAVEALRARLKDPAPSVGIVAAEALILSGDPGAEPLSLLAERASGSDLRVALEAARSLVEIGPAASPVSQRMERARAALEGGDGGRRYRDFNYASFTGWALEAALIQVGAAAPDTFD